VERLEEVRLAGPVLPYREDEARFQAQLERSVRAEVAKRERLDDQIGPTGS